MNEQILIEKYKALQNDYDDLLRRIYKAINILELSAENKGVCTQSDTDTIQKTLLVLKGDNK